MPKNRAPHPPDETADELLAALRRNHPELTDDQIRALLSGEPARQDRKGKNQARAGWTVGARGPHGGGGLVGRGRSRAGRGARRGDR